MPQQMAKLHSASPREITSPFTREIISKLHSKACNYLYKYIANISQIIYIFKLIMFISSLLLLLLLLTTEPFQKIRINRQERHQRVFAFFLFSTGKGSPQKILSCT